VLKLAVIAPSLIASIAIGMTDVLDDIKHLMSCIVVCFKVISKTSVIVIAILAISEGAITAYVEKNGDKCQIMRN
jgi:hypothetical protein